MCVCVLYLYTHTYVLRIATIPILRIDCNMPCNDDFLQYDINKNSTEFSALRQSCLSTYSLPSPLPWLANDIKLSCCWWRGAVSENKNLGTRRM